MHQSDACYEKYALRSVGAIASGQEVVPSRGQSPPAAGLRRPLKTSDNGTMMRLNM